ncbi:DUF1838 family protein [Sphingomonas sp. C3-2]|uniref:DUF1838 family protein n=1 Tax=Sphingomonas sp. C3-2 TaxID=3062169 RepID=UPI00294A9ACA|nr:DUF1838 family protein [Sphingomonas sp. C3-2]WOK35474.1 DUF1838 family protein [Sphingomonas sp. C3-2]
MMSIDLSLDRRSALLGLGAATAGLSLVATARASTAPGARPENSLPIGDPHFNMRTLARLQGDLSGRTVYAYSAGQVYGVRAGRALGLGEYGLRMYGYEGCSVRRSHIREDGKIETRSRSWLFYKDLDRNVFLDRYTNPYTGKTVDVPVFRAGITGEVLGPNGLELKANFGMKSSVFGKPIALDIVTIGDRAVVTRHGFTQWTPPGTNEPRTEFTTDSWACALADLQTEDAPAIKSTHAWTSQTEWQTWLQMPNDLDGAHIWRAEGGNVYSIEELPHGFVQYCMARDPNLLTGALG